MKLKAFVLSGLILVLGGCGGGGESIVQTPPSVDYQPVQSVAKLSLSSYENKINAIKILGPISLKTDFPVGMADSLLAANSYAFADFLGEGQYSMVSHTFEYNFQAEKSDQVGRVVFFKRDKDRWVSVDVPVEGGTQGCLHARKAVVSDFNLDGLPDVFFACTGLDLEPFPGEKSLLLLSTGAGFSKKWISSLGRNYTHGAAAADVNGDGYPDLTLANMADFKSQGECVGSGIFVNDKKGGFQLDKSLMPDLDHCKTSYSTEIIPISAEGEKIIFFGGHESEVNGFMQESRIFRSKNGKFFAAEALPMVPEYGLVLDIVHDDGVLYALRTLDGGNFYQKDLIQKITMNNPSAAEVIYRHEGIYSNGVSWINWLAFYQGKLVALIKDFNLSIDK